MKKENTKTRIKETALQLAFTYGYDHVSMKMIAAEVGITKPAIYHHFRNKKEMFSRAIDYFLLTMAESNREKLGHIENLHDFLEGFFVGFRQSRDDIKKRFLRDREKPVYTFLEILTSAGRADDTIKQKMAKAYDMTRENITKLLQVAVEKQEIRADLDLEALAVAIVAMFEGLSLQALFNDKLDTDKISSKLFENLWTMISL